MKKKKLDRLNIISMRDFIMTMIYLIMFSSISYSQEYKLGDHVKRPENKEFEGVWEYKNNANELIITLINRERVYNDIVKMYLDQIEGMVYYKKDGKIVINNRKMITSASVPYGEKKSLLGLLEDESGNKIGKIIFNFKSNEDKNTLEMLVPEREKIVVGSKMNEGPKSSLPIKILLKRR